MTLRLPAGRGSPTAPAGRFFASLSFPLQGSPVHKESTFSSGPTRPAPTEPLSPSSRLPPSNSHKMAINAIHWFGAFLLFAAMALLIVASVSAPIWDTVGFLDGTINGQSATLGTWGACLANGCSDTSLGYDRTWFSGITGTTQAGDAIVRGLSKTLILVPISAGVTFIALLFALSTHLVMGILASLLSLLALVVTIVTLGLSLGFFLTLRQRVNNNIPNSNLSVAECVWLVVAACGCQLFAALFVCFTRSRRSRKARDQEFATVPAMRETTATPVATTYGNDHYSGAYSTTGPDSTVGSTGPLVHDTTTAAEPMGPTTTSGVKGHWWNRKAAY